MFFIFIHLTVYKNLNTNSCFLKASYSEWKVLIKTFLFIFNILFLY